MLDELKNANQSYSASNSTIIEENEMEGDGSNSSEPGDTGSATYSETSNKA